MEYRDIHGEYATEKEYLIAGDQILDKAIAAFESAATRFLLMLKMMRM
ncbi:hypothetical protein RHO15_04345 [Utexia brackfieldae]